MNKFFLLAFVVAASIIGSADANANLEVCEGDCSEELRITCDELVSAYTLQGNCCSLETITAYDGCRVRVSGGNCYWFPKCEECPLRTEGRWQDIKCGLEYRSEEGSCPSSLYPTNWETVPPSNPSVDAALTWADYSCSPTMAPAVAQAPVSSATSNSVRVMAVLGMVMTVAVAQRM